MPKVNHQSESSPTVQGFWRRLLHNQWFWRGVIIVVLAATIIPASSRAWRQRDMDFADYWNAAHAMREGTNIYTSGQHGYIYPPLLAFVLQPLTFIPERVA